MVHYGTSTVDRAFAALADGTRRGILEWLARHDAEAAWMDQYRQRWSARFEGLDQVLEELKKKEQRDGNNDGTPV